MKYKFVLLLGILISVNLWNCDEAGTTTSSIKGELVDHSDCKFLKHARGNEVPDTLSCVEYHYIAEDNRLELNHINTAFNCCPGKLKCSFVTEENTILIEESETEAACDCNCLFDLEMELRGVEEKTYTIRIAEPYVNEEEWLEKDIDLKNNPEGSFCVVRKQYPWGLLSVI